jgi:hypothetical protein
VSRQTEEVVQFAGVNLTGVTVSNIEAIAKRLKLPHELVPAAKSMIWLALEFLATGRGQVQVRGTARKRRAAFRRVAAGVH